MHRIFSFLYTSVRWGQSKVEYLVLYILNKVHNTRYIRYLFFFLYEEIIISILKYLKNLQVRTHKKKPATNKHKTTQSHLLDVSTKSSAYNIGKTYPEGSISHKKLVTERRIK